MPDFLNLIKSNNIDGASVISGMILKVFENFAKNFDTGKTVKDFWDEAALIAGEIIKTQPFMASNYRRINTIFKHLRSAAEKCRSAKELIIELLRAVESEKEIEKTSKKICVNSGSKIIKDNSILLTYSSSSIVESVIINASEEKKNLKVMLSESRPVYEGKQLARNISGAGVQVIYMTDAVLPSMVKECDIVMLGTDWIAEDFFINKIGTKNVVKAANELKKPVYLFCTTEKLLSGKYFPQAEDNHNAKEIDKELSETENIRIFNPYFEKTDINRISGIITEKGLLSTDEVYSICSSIELENELVYKNCR